MQRVCLLIFSGQLYYLGATSELYMLEGFGGIIAVKPFGFRLTKTQLAVRRSGPRFEYHAIS